jgi:hypothetical protein
VAALAVDQRRLVDHHRKALAVLAHEHGLEAFALLVGHAAAGAGLALPLVLGDELGRPVGRHLARAVRRRETHHAQNAGLA